MAIRARFPSSQFKILSERVALSSAGSSTTTAGALAARAWMRAVGLTPPVRDDWRVDIVLDAAVGRAAVEPDEMTGTRFRIEIARDEWGFAFAHGGQTSWIRVTNVQFVHGADDFGLLHRTPPLKHLGELVRSLEAEHKTYFHRPSACVTATQTDLDLAARGWILSF